jgi:hypothetical protein
MDYIQDIEKSSAESRAFVDFGKHVPSFSNDSRGLKIGFDTVQKALRLLPRNHPRNKRGVRNLSIPPKKVKFIRSQMSTLLA